MTKAENKQNSMENIHKYYNIGPKKTHIQSVNEDY